jgi:hypothetical protein
MLYFVPPRRELLVGGCAGALLADPLLIGPWLMPLGEYVPVERTRLPYISRWFETPFCANANAPPANRQKIANVNLMFPRSHLDI